MTTPYGYLIALDPLNAITTTYTNLIGGWFYVFMISMIMLMVFFKSKNLSIVSTIGITVSSAMITLLPPEFVPVIYLVIVACVTGVLYGVFGPKGE